MSSLVLEWVKSLGLISLPVTLYFAWSKIGYKVEATYKWSVQRFCAQGISSVTLTNIKDRSVSIFGIHAVTGDYSIGLIELEHPIILKGLEAVTIDIPPVSRRLIGREEFDWADPLTPDLSVTIFLSTTRGTIKCRMGSMHRRIDHAFGRKLFIVSNSVRKFNQRIYDDRALFAVVFMDEKTQKTALIDSFGFIDWDYLPNAIPQSSLASKEDVTTAIRATGLEPLIKPFLVEDLRRSATSGAR